MRILDALVGGGRIRAETTAPSVHRSNLVNLWEGGSILSLLASSGLLSTEDAALRLTPVYRGTRAMADTMGALPCILYRGEDDNRQRAKDHTLYRVLSRRPNRWQTPFEFWAGIIGNYGFRMRAYAEIRESDDPRYPLELWPLHPARVRPERLENGRLRFIVTEADGKERRLAQDQVFRVVGFGLDGISPLSPVEVGQQALLLAMAAEQFGAAFFNNGPTPRIIFKSEGKRLSDSAKENIITSWIKKATGRKAQRPVFLEDGLSIDKVIEVNNEQSQFLQTRRFQTEEQARVLGVPLHKVGDLTKSNYNSLESENRAFINSTLGPIATAITQAIRRDLIPDEDEDVYAEFLFDALLRGDTEARMRAYAVAIQARVMVPNEARTRENMPRTDWGDDPMPWSGGGASGAQAGRTEGGNPPGSRDIEGEQNGEEP